MMNASDLMVTFRFEEDDLQAFQRYFWRTSRYVQRRVKRSQVVFGILAAVLLLAGAYQIWSSEDRSGDDANTRLGSILIAIGVAEVLVCASMPAISLRSTLRQNKQLMKAHGLERQFGPRTVRIDDGVMEHTYSQGTTRHPIVDMLAPALTDAHCFFMLTEMSAVVVPKTKITSGNLDALVAEFRRVQAAR